MIMFRPHDFIRVGVSLFNSHGGLRILIGQEPRSCFGYLMSPILLTLFNHVLHNNNVNFLLRCILESCLKLQKYKLMSSK